MISLFAAIVNMILLSIIIFSILLIKIGFDIHTIRLFLFYHGGEIIILCLLNIIVSIIFKSKAKRAVIYMNVISGVLTILVFISFHSLFRTW
ncbi:hypothetical protein MASR2M18_21300 [Ignavibacteria bacterium]